MLGWYPAVCSHRLGQFAAPSPSSAHPAPRIHCSTLRPGLLREEMQTALLQRIEQQCNGLRLTVCNGKFPRSPQSTRNFTHQWLRACPVPCGLRFVCALFFPFASAAERTIVRSNPPAPYPRSLTVLALTARVGFPAFAPCAATEVCIGRRPNQEFQASSRQLGSRLPSGGAFLGVSEVGGILDQPSENPKLRFCSSRAHTDFLPTTATTTTAATDDSWTKASTLVCYHLIPSRHFGYDQV